MTIEQERLTPTQEDREALRQQLEELLAKANEPAPIITYGQDNFGAIHSDWRVRIAKARSDIVKLAPTLLATLKSPPIAGGEGEQFGRVVVPASDPLCKALRPKPETIAAITRQEQANALALANSGDMLVGQTAAETAQPTTPGDVGKLCEALTESAGFYDDDWTRYASMTRETIEEAAALLTQMEAREQALREALKPAILRTAAHYLTRHGCRGLAIDVSELADLHDALLAPNAQQWKCRRCGQIVDMAAFKCGCTQSPSPWELINPDRPDAATLIEAQAARISALEKALEPFAREGAKLLPEQDRYSWRNTGLSNADLRTARALLNPTPTEER